MPLRLHTVLSIIAILVSIIGIVVSFTSRFASSREEAVHKLRYIAFRVAFFIVMLLCIAGFVYDLNVELSSTNPLTRKIVYNIAYDVAGISFIMAIFMQFLYFVLLDRFYNKR